MNFSTLNPISPPYSTLSSSPQISGDFLKSRSGRVGGFSFAAYVSNSVYMPYETLTPHKSFPRRRIHPQPHATAFAGEGDGEWSIRLSDEVAIDSPGQAVV